MIQWFKNRGKQVRPPDYWQEYESSFRHRINGKTPIEELEFVVLDLETTGLNVKKDRILSVGAIILKNWTIYVERCIDFRLTQEYVPDEKSIAVHGILPTVRAQDLAETMAIKRILDFVGNRIIVGHHIAFDKLMINQILRNLTGGKLQNYFIDTAQLARRLKPSTNIYQHNELSLDTLCKNFNIPMNDRHTAAGDAFLTAILFLKLLRRLEDRGVTTFKNLMR